MRTVSTSFLARPNPGADERGRPALPHWVPAAADTRRPGELPRPHAGLGLRRSPAGAILSSRQDSLFLRSAVSPFRAVWSHPPLKPPQERSPSKPTAALSAAKRGVVCSQRNNMHGCYINTNNWLCDILNKNIMSIWMKWQIYSIFFR